MSRPELRSRRLSTPEVEERINEYSATPDTAPIIEDKRATTDNKQVVEPKSKGFNYRMTPTRHKIINELRQEDERSFQWMLDKLVERGIEEWKKTKNVK